MKTLTSLVVAAALIAPGVASAQRIATPNTADRHEANLAQNKADKAAKKAERSAQKDRATERKVRAAMAGRVNLAADTRASTTASPN